MGGSTQIAPGETGLRLWVFKPTEQGGERVQGRRLLSLRPSVPRERHASIPDRSMAPHVFRTSRGLDKQFFHAGDAVFTLQGKKITPAVLHRREFRRRKFATMTSALHGRFDRQGRLSRRALRRCRVFGKFPPKSVIVDFNFAYNPNCRAFAVPIIASSPWTTCRSPCARANAIHTSHIEDAIRVPCTEKRRDRAARRRGQSSRLPEHVDRHAAARIPVAGGCADISV